MKDWRGTEISIGSRIVYPSRRGSGMWMREATVIDFDEKRIEKFSGAIWWERKITALNDNGKKVFPASERITVINPPLELPLKL